MDFVQSGFYGCYQNVTVSLKKRGTVVLVKNHILYHINIQSRLLAVDVALFLFCDTDATLSIPYALRSLSCLNSLKERT